MIKLLIGGLSVIYEMLTGKLPFEIKKGVRLNMQIYQKEVHYPESLNKNAKHLLEKLFVLDPKERLGSGPDGSENIKNEPYFKGIEWDDVLNKKIKPPFVSKLNSDVDLRYFDNIFTDEPINFFIFN